MVVGYRRGDRVDFDLGWNLMKDDRSINNAQRRDKLEEWELPLVSRIVLEIKY